MNTGRLFIFHETRYFPDLLDRKQSFRSTQPIVIAKEEMFRMLLRACPSFGLQRQILRDDLRDGEEFPTYEVLAEFARHWIGILAGDETAEFPTIFAVVERLHVEGDDFVREAATIGLLEPLQNTNLHETTTPDQFLPYLGPVTRGWWDEVDAFWRGERRYVGEGFAA